MKVLSLFVIYSFGFFTAVADTSKDTKEYQPADKHIIASDNSIPVAATYQQPEESYSQLDSSAFRTIEYLTEKRYFERKQRQDKEKQLLFNSGKL